MSTILISAHNNVSKVLVVYWSSRASLNFVNLCDSFKNISKFHWKFILHCFCKFSVIPKWISGNLLSWIFLSFILGVPSAILFFFKLFWKTSQNSLNLYDYCLILCIFILGISPANILQFSLILPQRIVSVIIWRVSSNIALKIYLEIPPEPSSVFTRKLRRIVEDYQLKFLNFFGYFYANFFTNFFGCCFHIFNGFTQ